LLNRRTSLAGFNAKKSKYRANVRPAGGKGLDLPFEQGTVGPPEA
jgi:hypothetical protein